MMRQCFLLFWLLVVLAGPVQASDSPYNQIRRKWRGPTTGGLPLATSSEDSSSTINREDSAASLEPLQSKPVALPTLNDEDSVWSLLRRGRPSFDIVPLPRSKQRRSRARSTNNNNNNNNNARRSNRPRQTSPSGTRFDLRPPSPERISQWYAPSESSVVGRSGHGQQKGQPPLLFNHDSVGMTNPVLRISNPQKNQGGTVHYDSDGCATVSLASSSSMSSVTEEHMELQDSWVAGSNSQQQQQPSAPTTSTCTNKPDAKANHWARVLQYKLRPQDSSRDGAESAWFPEITTATQEKYPKKWRRCRFRRRVGQGQACYERVREAALEWQFQHSTTAREGILPVHGSGASSCCFALDDGAAQTVQPIWSGPHTVASRRLVTFTTCGFKSRWLPKLYTFNPVMVVYDLLDQRGPGTTYTSTAYATLKGHLLRGEERVTVALRDGTGFVDVEILSYSRAGGSAKAKCVWPLIGRMQQRFFEHQMDYLEQVALPPAPPPPPAP